MGLKLIDGRNDDIAALGAKISLPLPSPLFHGKGRNHDHRPLNDSDWSYYSKCLTGGVLSSSIRWVLTPLDAIKCNMQVHPTKYPSFVSAVTLTYRQQGIPGLYRGLFPTIMSYSIQTGTKYAMYEFIKDQLMLNHHGYPAAAAGNSVAATGALENTMIYLVSAGCAEAVADILMCPWETLKVQMQTSSSHQPSSRLGPAARLFLQQPNMMFASLGPLWGRQILGTMANFATFETTVQAIYKNILKGKKDDYSSSSQLAVTFAAGYAAGIVSTVVSHPADTLISMKAKYPEKTFIEIYQHVGLKHLATQGLGPRMALTGSVIGFQWFIYDTFKTTLGLGTSGGC